MGEVEHPGILRDFLVEDGIEWDAIQAVIREAARDHGLLMMVFCLGAQLPADTLGGEIGRMEKPEFGLSDVSLTEEGKNDPPFQGFDPVYTTLHWHGTEIKRLPSGMPILAETRHCGVQPLPRRSAGLRHPVPHRIDARHGNGMGQL